MDSFDSWTLGHIYGWKDAKIVIDWLEDLGATYSVQMLNGLWTITYKNIPGQRSIFDVLPPHKD